MSFTIQEIKELEKEIADELNLQPNTKMSTVINVLTNKFGFEEPCVIFTAHDTVLYGVNDTPVMGLKVVIVAENDYDYDPQIYSLNILEEE